MITQALDVNGARVYIVGRTGEKLDAVANSEVQWLIQLRLSLFPLPSSPFPPTSSITRLPPILASPARPSYGIHRDNFYITRRTGEADQHRIPEDMTKSEPMSSVNGDLYHFEWRRLSILQKVVVSKASFVNCKILC